MNHVLLSKEERTCYNNVLFRKETKNRDAPSMKSFRNSSLIHLCFVRTLIKKLIIDI
jgi:hypothetical protein